MDEGIRNLEASYHRRISRSNMYDAYQEECIYGDHGPNLQRSLEKAGITSKGFVDS